LTQINLPKNYLTPLVIIRFGIVLASSGLEGTTQKHVLSLAGIATIFVDTALWTMQKGIEVFEHCFFNNVKSLNINVSFWRRIIIEAL
jgi:hypothetical protein